MKELVVITGDWHINSLVALCEDEVVLDNGAIRIVPAYKLVQDTPLEEEMNH
jgi:hypothetical protein